MKADQLQTAVIVVAAMLLGSGLTYWLLKDKAPVAAPAKTTPAATPAPPPTTSITPPPGHLEAQVRANDAVDEAQFDAAVSRAREARKAGTLKPLATTPEEFARELGALNYRIYDYAERHAVPPPEGSPEAAAAQREMDELLERLANLFSDDELLAKLEDNSPADLARSEANMAAGALGLDEPTKGKIADLLTKAYQAALPAGASGQDLTPEQEAEMDRKLEASNAKAIEEIAALLSPEQKKRFDAMGADQVLFGLRGAEDGEK